mmetsp:Transcript_41016/g.104900  ORF Transcript_41016/g.104900 Transcript_41016/m.104900 type:complete len:339 (-) Transcript_41016:383-1399(-)
MSATFELLRTAAVVAAWFFWNGAVLFTNRHLLTTGLTAPISLTLLHMIGSSAFSNGVVALCGYEKQHIQSRKQNIKVALLAATFGLSVVSGTASLKYIPVSFSEMISSTTPLAAALFSFLAARESQTPLKIFSLMIIAAGCIVSSNGEPSWHTLGFLLAVTATATRALRTVLGELLLACEAEKLNSMNLLRFMSTYVVIMLLPVVFFVEGPDQLVNVVLAKFAEGDSTFVFWFFFNIVSAFSVNLCQLLVTKYTGAVALQVLGIFKGVAVACLSIAVFGNPVTVASASGYMVTVCGVAWYTWLRQREASRKRGKRVDEMASTQCELRTNLLPNKQESV